MAQDPEEAVAPSMPSSAIENTEVDFILPAEQIGPKLIELVGIETAEEVQPYAMVRKNTAARGQVYGCPECGGVLEEVEGDNTLRFRCRVGHTYSPESLLADQNVEVEKALWEAVRVLEEQADFSERLAAGSRRKKRQRLANRFDDKAKASRENASVLRDLLQKAVEHVLDVPEKRTGT